MKSVLFALHSQLDDFSKSEKKVAQFIIDHPQETIKMNADEISHEAGVSSATVVRLAKNLSKDGLPGLKIQLSSEIKVDDNLYTEIDPDDSLKVVKQKMEFRIGHTIEQTNAVLGVNEVQQAAELIEKASNVYAYGLGASNIVAADLQQKFIRVGKPVVQTMDTHLIAVGLTQPQSILVLISNSGETIESQKLAEAARSLKVPVISITHNAKSKLARRSDIVLEHDDSEENTGLRTAATTSLMAQLYVVDLLYYAYLTRNFEENAEQLRRSRDVIGDWFK